MSLAAAQGAWRDWLKSERRLAGHTLVAYEHGLRWVMGHQNRPPRGCTFDVCDSISLSVWMSEDATA